MNEKSIITDIEELNSIGRCEEIDIVKENKLMREIISNIKKTMKKNNLTSLSAPGIGYNKRIFCIDYTDNEIKTYINPIISYSEGIELTREVCSSLPNREYIRPRNKIVDIYYQTPTGGIKNNRFKGVVASIIQHEIDHLEGITLEDIGLEVEEDFDSASDEDRLEVINMYIESLDLRLKDVQEDIESNPTLDLVSTRLKFIEALARGDIELYKEDNIEDDGNPQHKN